MTELKPLLVWRGMALKYIYIYICIYNISMIFIKNNHLIVGTIINLKQGLSQNDLISVGGTIPIQPDLWWLWTRCNTPSAYLGRHESIPYRPSSFCGLFTRSSVGYRPQKIQSRFVTIFLWDFTILYLLRFAINMLIYIYILYILLCI